MGRSRSQHGAGKQWVEGKRFRLADEVRYIQTKAADHDSRVVAIGQLVLFSTDTGDAWLLDVTDQLAAPLARDGDPEPWKGHYRIDGPAFIYTDRDSGRIRTVLGYPTQKIAQAR